MSSLYSPTCVTADLHICFMNLKFESLWIDFMDAGENVLLSGSHFSPTLNQIHLKIQSVSTFYFGSYVLMMIETSVKENIFILWMSQSGSKWRNTKSWWWRKLLLEFHSCAFYQLNDLTFSKSEHAAQHVMAPHDWNSWHKNLRELR